MSFQADRSSPFNGTNPAERPATGDSATTSTRLGNTTRLTTMVYNDSQIVKALFVALRTAVPRDVRLELLHTSADELKFLIAAQPRVSSFSHRQRHSLRHPALAMATKRFYFRRRERQAAYEQYMQEQQQQQQQAQQQQELAAQGGGGLASSPQQDALETDEVRSPRLAHSSSLELTNSMSFAGARAAMGSAGGASTRRARVRRKGKGVAARQNTTSPVRTRSASVSFADRTADGPFTLGSRSSPQQTSLADSALFSLADGDEWNDFSMSVSNALWHYRRGSHASSSRLHGGGGDWGLNGSNTLPVMTSSGGGARRKQSLGSLSSIHSGFSPFGTFNTSMSAMRVLEGERASGRGARGGGSRGLELRSSVRSLLAGEAVPRGGYGVNASAYTFGNDDGGEDDYPTGPSTTSAGRHLPRGGRGRREGSLGSTASDYSIAGSRRTDAAASTDFDSAEEHEYRLFQQFEDQRWNQLGLCYDLLLRTTKTLSGKSALAAAGDALVNDAIRRFWERVTISPAAEDVHRQELLNTSRVNKANAAPDGTATGASSSTRSGGVSVAAGQSSKTKATTTAAAAAKRSKQKTGAASKTKTKSSAASVGAAASGTKKQKTTAADKKETTPSADRSAEAEGNDLAASESAQRARDGGDAAGSDVPSPSLAPTQDADNLVTPTGGAKTPGGAKKKKKKNKGTVATNLPNVAAYMTSMQYIYLNMRIAQVLLPQRKELEVEMLESVQEDLILDASYEPRAGSKDPSPRQTPHTSGAEDSLRGSIRGRSPSDDGRSSSRTRGEIGAGNVSYFGPPPQWLLSRGEPLLLSGRAFAKDRGGVIADHNARLARQRGRGSLVDEDDRDDDDDLLLGGGSMLDDSGVGGGVVAPWNPDRLPSLHYAQFWVSMLELADNWTCTAGNPVDMYIFLMELYGEVFGHDWDDEDEQLVKAMRAVSATARNAAKEAALMQNMQDALQSFHDLVNELDDLTSSSSDSEASFLYRDGEKRVSGGHGDSMTDEDDSLTSGDDDDVFLRKRLKRHAKRRARRRQRDEGGSGSDEDGTGHDGRLDHGARESEDDDGTAYDWRYVQRVGKDGNIRYFRRRVQYTKSRRRLKREAAARARGDDPDELSDHDSDLSVYIVEEELNKQKRVIHRRRARCHLAEGDLKRVQARLRRKARRQAKKGGFGETDSYMYENDGPNGQFRRRKYFDARPRKMRKLEGGRWAEDYNMDEDLSDISSWSSFDDEGGRDALHVAGGRRGRTRHRGPRRERRRYGRSPGYYYDQDDDSDDEDESLLDEDDLLDNFSELSLSVVSDAIVSPAVRADGHSPDPSALTATQREELRRKKKWLQETLAERGIHIADETFTDPNEEPLLYELLQMTERLMKRKRAKDSAGAGGGGDGEGEEDDIGMADFDAALLAKLFSKPKQYSLDELQQSALMEKLLRMGEELGADKMPLTSKQLDDVLAALLNPGSGRAVETTSMKRRRERLIQEARQLREDMKRAEKAKRRQEREEARLREEAEAAAAAEREKETFNLTGVPGLDEGRPCSGGSQHSKGSHRSPPTDALKPSHLDDDDEAERPFTGLTTSSLGAPTGPRPRPLSGSSGHGHSWGPGGAGAGKPGGFDSSLATDADYDAYFQLHPLTAAQRKEQERLFREFDDFAVSSASQGGKYKVTFTAYTPEQFEAFYRHLHLGPQQRALLRGRAPLAPATSVQGGTYHQLPTLANNRNVGVRYEFSLGTAKVKKQYVGAGGEPAEVCKPAPVKLFTLTTKDTLQEAIEENFSSYLDDRAYKDSLLRVQATAASRPTSGAGSSTTLTSRAGLSHLTSGGGLGAPPPLSSSATLLPPPSTPGAREKGRGDAGADRLPRIGIGFRRQPAPPSSPPASPRPPET